MVNRTQSYVITNVTDDKTYVLYVIAVGNNGASQPSEEYYINVLPGIVY